MHAIDWLIVCGLLAILLVAAVFTSRYTKSVSAFLAASRCGRRYLIAMALAMAGTGVTTLVYWFEIYYEAGFPAYWWSSMTEPALIVIALSGWVVYRYRQTRAMTLAQFFEMRYSRNFRVFAGFIAFVSGIINFGIYPAVGARFLIALCGLPDSLTIAGHGVSVFVGLMAALILVALLFAALGGQIAVMVTDFIQGVFANTVFVVLIIFLLGWVFRWDQIEHVLLSAQANKSPIHPMHMSGQNDFNLSYFLIAVAVVFYTFNAWQGTSGYNCCAKDAHEAKMAGVLYGWRFRLLLTFTVIVPICVMTLLNHPDFSAQASALRAKLESIPAPTSEQQHTLQGQLRMPYALAMLLPQGLLGLVVGAVLAAFISTHVTCLHSWGSIFLQDVVLPFRKRSLSPRAHLWLLRLSMCGVAVFIFCFSVMIKPTQFLAMFFAITGAVFVGGAGAAIIGGLYWKRGSTHGAWAGMITGIALSTLGVGLKQVDSATLEALKAHVPGIGRVALFIRNGLTGQEQTFIAMCSASVMYVLVSLLGPRHVADMDKLLHRGRFAMAGEGSIATDEKKSWLERLGIDREFTRGDRWLAYASIGWPLLWSALFIVVTIWNLFSDVPDVWWARFWRVWIWVFTGGAAIVTLWYSIGGAFDLIYLFRRLKTQRDNPDDDGRVNDPPAQSHSAPSEDR